MSRIKFFGILSLAGATAAAHTAGGPSRDPHAPDLVHLENFLVSATPLPRDQSEIIFSTHVLSGRALTLRRQATLGDTLDAEPGIAATGFAPGASRPVIRGLTGDRIRVLNNGLGVLDASVASPDHAVAIEPLVVERIEVIRGPATLLYGSNAIGGVVNALDNRLPLSRPAEPLSARTELRTSSASHAQAGVLVLEGAHGDIGWHVDGAQSDAEDLKIPGFANEAAPDRVGILPNSARESRSFAGGLSYFGQDGFGGASFSRLDSEYGAVAEEDARIKLRHRRVELKGESREHAGIFSGSRASATFVNYRHTEYEGAEVGTQFTNKGHEARAELLHENFHGFSGSWGIQFDRSDFAAVGEEAFLPASLTKTFAVFAFEERKLPKVTYQFGARAGRQTIRTSAHGRVSKPLWSLAGGLIAPLGNDLRLAATLTHTERAPNAQERYSDGPHVGTHSFDVGDPGLGLEKSNGLDVTLRQRAGRVTGAITGFVNRFDGFIFAEETGATDPDGLPIHQYVQRDVDQYGAEVELLFHLHESRAHTFDLRLTADTVRAREQDGGAALPRITPTRAGVALDYRGSRITAAVGVQGVDRARRVAPSETGTAGFGLVQAHVSYHFDLQRHHFEVFLRGTNLTNRMARNHVSFLKDVAPMAGRDVTLGVTAAF